MTMLEPRVDGVPVPSPSPESQPYWEGTRAGELRYQVCTQCDAANFGPGLRCRACQGAELAWRRSAGEGALYSWTVVWRPQTPAFEVPYAPAIVRLDEGYDMVSALVGLDPVDIVDGMRLRIEFHPLNDTITLPFFRPV